MEEGEGAEKPSNATEKQETTSSGRLGEWLREKSPILHKRYEQLQDWWQKVKAKSQAALGKQTATSKVEPTFARTAGLVLWAPTAALCAPIGAALITAFVIWLARPTYIDNGRVISLASFSCKGETKGGPDLGPPR